MRTLLVSTLALVLLAPGLAAEPEAQDGRRVDPRRRVELPCRHVQLRDDLRLTEGPRSLRDAFPYLAVAPEAVSSTGATVLTPKNLRHFLVLAPQEGGSAPAAVRTGEGAIEAVRLFVAGPLVRTSEAAARIVDAGRALADELEVLSVQVTEHRPKTYEAQAEPLEQDRSIHSVEAWRVSLVALELDPVLRLVHVEARVRANGEMEIECHPVVVGPATSRQTAVVGQMTEAQRLRRAKARAEVETVRARLAGALEAVRDLDTAWAVARAGPRMDAVRLWLGEPDRDVGSGIHIHAYDLVDGSSVLFGEAGGPLLYVLWADAVGGTFEGIRRRRTLVRGGS